MKHASLVLPVLALLFMPTVLPAAPSAAAAEPAASEPGTDLDITSLLVFGIGAVALIVTHRLASRSDRRD